MDAPAGGDLYVATKSGQIRAIRNGTVDPVAVLDISSEVSTGGEQGLLGLAISPDLGYLYVDFTDTSGDTRIREYRLSGGRAETSSLREVLKVAQPYANHNGGDLHFGPDRYLYITLGDGGSAGDPSDNGQSLDTLLGKILRINPRPSGSAPYSVPSDNPFVSRSGAKPEIWAYGLRNPWRLSFDKSTNDMYIGDVGQDAWEEIDYQASNSRGGLNYGWKRREGTHTYQGSPASNETLPIYEYSHADGNCSITGGYVYRGQAIPALQGAYLFADYCAGRLRAFVPRNGQAINHRFLGPEVGSVTAFGQDLNGELYVLSGDSGVYRIDPA